MIGRSSPSSASRAQTAEKVRKRCVEEGLEAALGRRKQSRDCAPVLDGEGAAPSPVANRRRVVHTISHETLRPGAQKKEIKPWRQEMGCIAPKQDAAFGCAMEQVPGVYSRPYEAAHPVLGMDETTKHQYVCEVRTPLPTLPGQRARLRCRVGARRGGSSADVRRAL